MANKALGRDLGDLLSRARPARIAGLPAAASTSPGSAAGPVASGGNLDPGSASEATLPLPFALESSADSGSAASSQGPPAGPNPGANANPGNTRSAPVYRPAQSGAPASEPVFRRSVWFYVLLGGDGLLVVLAAVLVFGGWMHRPWAKATAIGALVMGGAMSALAVTLPRREGQAASRSGESRVRVHLTRV